MSLSAAFISGAMLAGGLIVAVGPQNMSVLATGAAGRHVAAVVGLCVAADVLLIGLAVAGASRALQSHPQWLWVLQWAAVPMLLWMAFGSARRALWSTGPGSGAGPGSTSMREELARTAMLTFGNPAVWIETVLVVGAAAVSQGDASRHWAFATGACVASAIWFSTLGFGARLVAHWLRRESVLRGLSAFSAALLAAAAWQVAPRHDLERLGLQPDTRRAAEAVPSLPFNERAVVRPESTTAVAESLRNRDQLGSVLATDSAGELSGACLAHTERS